MAINRNILESIGDTPIVEIKQIDTGLCRLFVKLENQNPGGSIKDRIGLTMIEAAEREGKIKPGGTLIEATAGNTGLALALVAAQKGYKLILVVPDKMSQDKVFHLKALGAEVRLTRSDVNKGHPAYYQDIAERLAREIPNSFYVNQFQNPANPLAHETWTGPEIWAQMGHDLDAVVVGVGSGGTLTGLGRFFKRVNPKIEMVLADPVGSVLTELVKTGQMTEAGSWLVEGIGEDFVPDNCDLSLVRAAYPISDKESFFAARDLLRTEGILGGSSTGTLFAAALKYCREQTTPKRVLTFIPDTGNKYLSKMYNDYWMIDQGLLERPREGNLKDLISRRYEDGGAVTVAPDDRLLVVYRRMKLYEVSQLPVLEDGKLIGIVDESDLLLAVTRDAKGFDQPVSAAMVARVETIAPNADITTLLPIFAKDHVAVVEEEGRFYGIITRIDLLNHLRTKVA
ncbi:cystathionine beta-synthase [Aliidongia dinghuensis]|uniref:Cysteine synthase B n=1 Tax=Aliidongia dinghuensis TaxID=1867774 RepID=A0A8J3E653_9PROT|nr:pyridoxal-phosphate dependent enzyme [Aliidongia dinghuensis]GGF40915.1 cystathionine beta-synthase [Aliidongia dinghuensis]